MLVLPCPVYLSRVWRAVGMKSGMWTAGLIRAAVVAAAGLSASLACAQGNPGNPPERMLISEYLVEGNTVLPVEMVERALMAHTGPDRSVNDVYAARDALAKAYEAAGYSSAAVEAERIDPVETPWGKGWVAVLKVVEGRVGRLKVTGAEYTLPSTVRERMPSVAEGEVPHFPTFQEELAAVSRMSGVAVTPLLRPGLDPGTMEVELKVEDSLPFGAWAELSNEQSPDTTPRRLDVGFRYDNLWQAQHSFNARYITTPMDSTEVQVLSLNYGMPVGRGTDKLSLYTVLSNSSVQVDTGTGQIGNGETYGFRWTTIPRTRAPYFHSVTLGADYKNSREQSSQVGFPEQSKPVRYIPFSAQYVGVSPDDGGRWQLNSGVKVGFSGLTDQDVDCNGRTVDQFECRQAGASASFMAWTMGVRRIQRLGDWRFIASGDAQFASGPLIGSEDFYIGGADSVRGYLQSEQGGEDGGRLSLEIMTPSLLPGSFDLNLLAFYDAGIVRVAQPLPGQTESYSLNSAGAGIRVSWSKYLSGSLDWARTFTAASRTADGASRLHASVRAEF